MESRILINILVRTSNRPAQFSRCIASIREQTYRHRNVIIGYDNTQALKYIPAGIQTISYAADCEYPYYYDRYCNILKSAVNEGWFFFLDDDDTLSRPTILEELSHHLQESGAIICQMLRNGIAKPRDAYIKRGIVEEGKIGLPCLVLHSDYRLIGELDGQKAGDYRYIKTVIDQVPTKYICLPLVDAGTRGHGKMQQENTSFQKFQ